MELQFHSPALLWEEASPIGSGFLGAMVYGGVEKEQLMINEDSLWSGDFLDRTNQDSLKVLDTVRELLENGKVKEAQDKARLGMYGRHQHMRHYEGMGQVYIDYYKTDKKLKAVKDGMGEVRIFPSFKYSDYERSLNLSTGIVNVSYKIEDQTFSREYFASNPDQIIACRLESDGPISFSVTAERREPTRNYSDSRLDDIEALEDGGHGLICLIGRQPGKEKDLKYCMGIYVSAKGGTCYRMGSSIVVEDAQSACVYITGRTDFRSPKPREWCEQVLKKAGNTAFDTLRKRHIEDFGTLADSFRLSFGEKDDDFVLDVKEQLKAVKEGELSEKLLEAYFHFGKYLLLSSSRKGSLPANLQGIWCKELTPVWGARYTININIQMNYWMAEKCGYSDMHLPLFDLLKRMYPNGSKVAEDMYGVKGFCCHHNTDIWGDCAPQDRSDTATIWPVGGAWLSLHIMEHYRYTKDMDFLEDMYAVLRDSARFFTGYMVKNAQGEWVTGPSVSPENSYYSKSGEIGALCMGPAMDIQIVYEVFNDFLEAQGELCRNRKNHAAAKDADLASRVKTMLNDLVPIKIGKYGQICEWMDDYEEVEPGHRHISQLFALYPGKQIRLDLTPEYAGAAKRTLQRRLLHGGGHTGWSKAWIIHFFARLGEGETAFQNLRELLTDSTYDNLFDKCPPFQIDGNLGGADAVLDMLVQDYEDEVWLLPALPTKLPKGELSGFCLKNGAVLSMDWENGHVKKVMIKARRECGFVVKASSKVRRVDLLKGMIFIWEVEKDEVRTVDS